MSDGVDFTTWRVLAVDDQADNLALFSDLLAARGVTVATAYSGEQALELIDQFQPTLVLIDLAMPGMDGWALLKALRGRPDLQGVPLVAVSSLVPPAEAHRIVQAGFDGCIAKPFRVGDFFGEMVASIRRVRERGEPGGS